MQHQHSNCHTGSVGIVYGCEQRFSQVYPAQVALRSGTLFPELNKPMACAAAPTGCAEPTPQQASAFAAWEMRLYLNTHPNDESALQMFEQICRQTHQPNYACTFAPCVHNGCWTWIQDPWPWELEENEGRA